MRLRNSSKNKALCIYPNSKLNDEVLLDQRNTNEHNIQTNKIRKCVVRIKRIHAEIVGFSDNHNTVQTTISNNRKIPNKLNCVVRLKRISVSNNMLTKRDSNLKSIESSVRSNCQNSKHKKELSTKHHHDNNTNFPDKKHTSLQTGIKTTKTTNIIALKQSRDNALYDTADISSNDRLHGLNNINKVKTVNIKDKVNQNNVTTSASNRKKLFSKLKNNEVIKENSKPAERIVAGNKTLNVIDTKKNLNKNKTKSRNLKTGGQKLEPTSEENIYEFLSQTKVTDSNDDPAADIIKKLISEGKVRVTRNCKGRPKVKYSKKVKKVEQKSQPKVTRVNEDDAASVQEVNTVNKNTDRSSPTWDNDMIDDLIEENVHSETNIPTRLDKPIDDNSSSIFSHLARKVLLKQTGTMQHKRKLLEIAKKYVSTPNNKNLPIRESHISPISGPKLNPLATCSPWRIRVADKLPTVFNFNTTSSNLPSYSSFHIPSTPQKNKNKSNISSSSTNIVPCEHNPVEDANNTFNHTELPVPENSKSIPTDKSNSTVSFSSNDSNGENIPPIQNQVNYSNNTDENADIFNSRHLPNPRKILGYRSPLKAINIIEVVSLPPWKNTDANKATNTNITKNIVKSKENRVETCDNSLFGFEDFINLENSNLHNELEKQNEKAIHNKTLCEKLHELKKWRPEEKEILHPNTEPIKEVFEEYEDRPKQRCIKEMLCSTFISSPQKKNQTNKVNDVNKIADKQTKIKSNESFVGDTTNLFQDDPECTFDEKRPHRTYVKPFRKIRKVRNNLVMYIDSDESGDECNENRSNEHDTSDEKETGQKKKRKRRELKENPALNSFIEEFNEICNEVDQYQLLVE